MTTDANHSGPTGKSMQEIDLLIRSRYPVLYLLTHEEGRLEYLLLKLANDQGKQFFTWTSTRGLTRLTEAGGDVAGIQKGDFQDPSDVLRNIQAKNISALFMLKDFHVYLEDPQVIRLMRDVAQDLKGSYKNIIITAPRLTLPAELDKDVTVIDFPLPNQSELMELLRSVCRAVAQKNRGSVQLTNADAQALVQAALGLTLSEAENAFAKAAVTDGVISRSDVDIVLKEKQQIIRKSGMLEFYPADSSMGDVGGLELLKQWLKRRSKAFETGAAEFGLPAPKGVLLLGAPGCGKSLTAKAVASAWQLPLLRLDLGRIFSGLLGSSEDNMRRAIKVAEGVAPAVLWIDEIEKGLAGNSAGQSDGGTASRVFGTLLTWMQEKSAKVFVVATANRIEILPPELLRRGRFDEIFFVDLPGAAARAEILSIHLSKRKRDPAAFNPDGLAGLSEGFSGAELEHCVTEGMFFAFDAGRELSVADIEKAISETVPLSVTSSEELRRSREWAKRRARSADPADERQKTSARADHIEVDFEKG